MKPLAFATGLLGLVATALAVPGDEPLTSPINLPKTFKPAPNFKNANLVHIISLEKNYVKENINVLIENVGSRPHNEYFVPFSASQMERVGGFEVKDRKDSNAGPFYVQAVEFDPESDIQYYRITLPKPLEPEQQQTLGISYFYTKAYAPLPASIAQDEPQYLVYDFSAYCPSVYPTSKQKTEVKAAGSNIPDYTKVPGAKEGDESPQKQGAKLTYGPFADMPAGATLPVQVRFEFTKPVNHVAVLERDVEVSHWGGNVAFEERYTLLHRGANLSTLFNRVKWAQSQYYNPVSYALKEMKFQLRGGSADAYYTDAIGNVSTSRFRSNDKQAVLEIKPRYPVFGGWKYPFTIGWNSDAHHFLRKTQRGGYVLSVPFLEGPRQPEGVEYEHVIVRVILPEGAENVKFHTTLPESSITETSVETVKTYLDTIGRTALTIKARNLVDEFRDRELVISYDYPFTASLRKPIIIFASMVGLFAAAWVLGNVEVKFASKK